MLFIVTITVSPISDTALLQLGLIRDVFVVFSTVDDIVGSRYLQIDVTFFCSLFTIRTHVQSELECFQDLFSRKFPITAAHTRHNRFPKFFLCVRGVWTSSYGFRILFLNIYSWFCLCGAVLFSV